MRLVARLCLLGALGVGVARGSELIQVSPFIPANAPAAPVVSTGGAIEFRGTVQMPDGLYFNIYNTATRKPALVKVGDPSNPFVVRSYKENTEQIVVDYQGVSQTLSMKKSRIQSIGGPVAVVPPGSAGAAAANAPPPPGTAAAPNLPPGASIEEWAAEVQRRRELRTAPGTPQPTPTAVPAQPAAPPRG